MNLKKGEIIELTITDLAFGGAGVGKLRLPESAEFVVFVEGVVPGDIVQARFTKIKKQFAEASLEKIITPSPERISPRCKHFGVCGGCCLQFMDYENQLKWKEKMVFDSLRQIGGFKEVKVEPIIGCDSPWYYRNKMEYSFGASFQTVPLQRDPAPSRTDSSSLSLGLHPSGDFRSVFDLEECFLQSPASIEIARAVRRWGQEKALSFYSPTTGSGVLKNLVIRDGKNTNEIMVNLVTNGGDFPEEKDFAKFITEKFPQVTSIYRTAVTVQRGFKTSIKEFHLSGKPYLTETLNIKPSSLNPHPSSFTFDIAPQAFFQPNTKQAEILYGKVLEFADTRILLPFDRLAAGGVQDDSPQIALDLFCGTGAIGMALAKSRKQVFGIEINESAVESARRNSEKNSIKNIEFLCGDVGKLLPHLQKLLFPATPRPSSALLVTDPPRAGIDQKTLLKILALKIPKWIYVSCNPTTLARDLKLVAENGYKLQKIQPVDMFPHTYHVETVCLLIL